MENIMKSLQIGAFGIIATSALLLLVTPPCFGQTNLNFNGISATAEGAIQISWNSTLNETYEIDEADALDTNSDGSTQWNLLYTEYPSQGTSTFWLDTGNYFASPEIVHPKYSAARFYRIVDLGVDNTTDEPSVTVSAPTNGTVASDVLTITVSAASDQSFLTTALFVDGQQMNDPDVTAGTNSPDGVTNYETDTYYLNTCEWFNGPHALFATARCQSGAIGTHDQAPPTVGHAVSAFVPVTFSNLIQEISFTQPFFAPEDGTTQQVTAVFAANVDWTLQIQDVDTNTVRTVTGSGGTMLFDWDGTGDAGTNLPVGTYTYLISAMTNGLALPVGGGSGGSGGSGVPLPDFAGSRLIAPSDSTELWAQPADGTGLAVPLVIYPPGFDTSGFDIFEAPTDWNPTSAADVTSTRSAVIVAGGSSGFSPDYSGASSQSSRAPVRPPTKPVRGRAGVYGVAYQTYSGNGSGYTLNPPQNGLGLGPIPLEGKTAANSRFIYEPLPEYKREANNFINQMQSVSWSKGFAKVDNALSIGNLQSSDVFNTVKLGLLLLHGTYTTAMDNTENGAQEIYFPITSGKSAQYLRMSDMNLGGATTNGLQWMGILACNSLRQGNWNSMRSASRLPINSNLHLILGANSVIWTGYHVGSYWAKYMTVGKNGSGPMQIGTAWTTGVRDAYAETRFNYTNAMSMSVAGASACQNDSLQTNSSPGSTTFYTSSIVWP